MNDTFFAVAVFVGVVLFLSMEKAKADEETLDFIDFDELPTKRGPVGADKFGLQGPGE